MDDYICNECLCEQCACCPALALQLVICRCLTQTAVVKPHIGLRKWTRLRVFKVLELCLKDQWVGIGCVHLLVTEILVQNCFFLAVVTFCGVVGASGAAGHRTVQNERLKRVQGKHGG